MAVAKATYHHPTNVGQNHMETKTMTGQNEGKCMKEAARDAIKEQGGEEAKRSVLDPTC